MTWFRNPFRHREGFRRSRALFCTTVAGLTAVVGASARAEAGPAGNRMIARMEAVHEGVSRKLETSAQRFDSFFGEDRVYEEATGTYFQWRARVTWNESWSWDLANRFRLKLRLPRVEDRFKLLIETNPEEDLEDGTGLIPGDIIQEASDGKNLAAGIEFARSRIDKWMFSLSPGIRFTRPLDPFVRLRARRSFENTFGVARVTGKLSWFNESGWEFSTNLDLDRPIGDTDLLRSSTKMSWNEEDSRWFPEQTFTYHHRLDENQALSASTGARSETKPTLRPVRFFFNFGYRRRLYKNWLYGDLTPQVVYERDNDFNPDWSLTFQLETLVGQPFM